MRLSLLTEKSYPMKGQWQITAHIAAMKYGGNGHGEIYLSPDCKSTIEVCAWADNLIKQLKHIKNRAEKMSWNNRPRRRRETL